MASKLIKWKIDGRGWQLEYVGVVTELEWELLKNYGRIYLGEVAGKHSDVEAELEEADFKVITENQVAIDVFNEYLGGSFGFDLLGKVLDDAFESEDERAEFDSDGNLIAVKELE